MLPHSNPSTQPISSVESYSHNSNDDNDCVAVQSVQWKVWKTNLGVGFCVKGLNLNIFAEMIRILVFLSAQAGVFPTGDNTSNKDTFLLCYICDRVTPKMSRQDYLEIWENGSGFPKPFHFPVSIVASCCSSHPVQHFNQPPSICRNTLSRRP